MRRTVLLLAAMALAMLLASGVALAVTKHCGRDRCVGTEEDDRLLGNDAPNWMLGRGGNDTLRGFDRSDAIYGGGKTSFMGGAVLINTTSRLPVGEMTP